MNKGVLADCVSEIDKNTKSDRQYQFDLNKMYETKLRALYLEDTKVENGNTGWVTIPSKSNDPENFEKNVEKLKTLSHKNWCTKSFNAEPYLSQGDFHVYLEDGQPKLGVRFLGDEIQEIQGEENDGKIPAAYFDEVKKHIDENGLQLTSNSKKEIKSAQKVKAEIDKVKADLKEAIESNDAKSIFRYFGISVGENKNGLLTISEYKMRGVNLTFSDLGIDEDKLLEKVEEIVGDGNFRNSKATNLSNLKYIRGNAFFENSKITNLGKLKFIGGQANFKSSRVTDLGSLEYIGDDVFFGYNRVNMGKLKTIKGRIFSEDKQFKLKLAVQCLANPTDKE